MTEQRICPLCKKTFYDDCRCSEIMYVDKITELEAALAKIAGYDGLDVLTRHDCAMIARKAVPAGRPK